MKTPTQTPAPLLCFVFIVVFLLVALPPPCSSSSDEFCTPYSCNDGYGPEIKFPFRITGRQHERCGYPGFNLSCNDLGETIITLPSTPGSFVVNNIDYASQMIQISDPDNCLSQRILNLSLAGSPFRAPDDMRYTILSCSFAFPLLVPCEGNMSKSVIAVPGSVLLEAAAEAACVVAAENVSIPIPRSVDRDDPAVFWGDGVVTRLELRWEKPNCRDCGGRNKLCGFSTDQGLEIGCSDPPPNSSKGIPRSAEYGIIVGAAIPSLLCLIGLLFCGCRKIKNFTLNSHNSQVTGELPIMKLPPMPTARGGGLGRQTIQSYPTMVLGESLQLPNPNGNTTCPICLSEYQAEEILGSIPDCNHYFHANCIDEWLGLNATCPLCRKSPESLGTELSSLSLSSSTSPTSSASIHE
ncbi:PREDICTED: putative RING-H2 finger protein ATL21A [Ipomoea nil]|uniref:putative RING-H2 finger protein ATL21A n=1 Tax=Ipomoea nil TaxID=35883 RepID=UPI00090170E7|nr:PREDICTED: putative RING-H2 finger protein ATL21A [Ipomoea nil]